MRYFIEFSYNGSEFHGWQRQKNALTVQQILEESLSLVQGDLLTVVGAGRTDSGVHARLMVAHFDVNELSYEKINFIFKLNQLLPKSIVILNLRSVKLEAHSRFDAISRTYFYYISLIKNPFDYPLHYFYNGKLDWKLMNQASEILTNHKDFQCFSKSNTDVKTFLCDINKAKWNLNDNGAVFEITANRFLRNMVRAIVGTLIEIGNGKKNINQLEKILASKKRANAGYSAPANGLFLTKIIYPNSIYLDD
tara:strand:- start:367 stop:1119 length:753 start_codon:yes stop_codon:yes gene_type:complete